MKQITIITPLYKGERYIEKLCTMIEQNCIKLKERYPEVTVEYIMVNDSPGNIISVLTSDFHYNLRILDNPSNLGIHQSRVNGICASDSEFIYFLDQDDEIKDNFLLDQFNKIGSHDVIISNGYRKFENENVVLYKTKAGQKLATSEHMYLYGTDMILSPGQCLIRRSAIPECWYRHILNVNGCDDFALWLLMFKNRKKFTINSERLYYHTENSDNYSASTEKMTESYMKMCQLLLDNQLIEKKKIRILVRRYKYKVYMKSNKTDIIRKLIGTFRNLDIVMNTLLYKSLGYH